MIDFFCEKDFDCFYGKCCGILGGNMCIYLYGKDIVGNVKYVKDLVLCFLN